MGRPGRAYMLRYRLPSTVRRPKPVLFDFHIFASAHPGCTTLGVETLVIAHASGQADSTFAYPRLKLSAWVGVQASSARHLL